MEEIKTCRIRPALIPAAVSRMHLAQARIYAALIAIERNLDRVEVRLTWFNIDTGEETPLSQAYSRDELEGFLASSLAMVSGWLVALAGLRRQRDLGLRSLAFPTASFVAASARSPSWCTNA